MKKLLSCVGTGTLYDTIYRLGEHEYRTRVVQKALCQHYLPDEVILFVTEEAKAKNLPDVTDALGSQKVTIIDIPVGKSEAEIWQIFSLVTGAVHPDDEIVFDITHGFRSLPFIALLSIAYLREICPFTLAGVVYGAFDAPEKNPADSEHTITRAPVFDLSGFVTIFDWMAGVRSFLHHADARLLKEQVERISDEEFSKTKTRSGTRPLKKLLGPLSTYAEAVRLSRPIEAMNKAREIHEKLPKVTGAIENYTPVLTPLLSKISEIERFAVSQDATILTQEALEKQRALIGDQVEKGLYQQAVTLAREWMVTVFLYAAGSEDLWLSDNVRKHAEHALNDAKQRIISERNNQDRTGRGPQEEDGRLIEWFYSQNCWDEVAKIWAGIPELRNQLAHCGMSENPRTVKSLENSIKNLITSLDTYYSLLISSSGNDAP